MATQNPTKAQTANSVVLASEDTSSATVWVNDGHPVVKFLLDMKRSKQAPGDRHSEKVLYEHHRLLEDSMARVALRLAEKKQDGDSLLEELEMLTAIRFKSLSSCVDFVPFLITRIALQSYQAGVASVCQLSRKDAPASALGAIAMADHDCPGSHDPE